MRWCLLIVVFLSIIPVTHAITSNPDVDVIMQSQSPDPVEPGQIVIVKFKIENSGDETKDPATVTILPKYPFEIYGDTTTKNIGVLRAGSTGTSSQIVEFKLKVDENAVEEETEIELILSYGTTSKAYINDDFMIDIETHDAVLSVTSIDVKPERIAPGETSKVDLSIKNYADSLLKDIKFKLDFTNVPLAPYKSSVERRIAQLQGGFQDTLSFNIIAEPDATAGLYKVPMNISYNDEKGNSKEINDILTLSIGAKPKIKAYIKKRDVYKANSAGTITIEVANAGTTDIKLLEMQILDNDKFDLISSSNYFYIGDVDADDTESEEIQIFTKKGFKNATIPVLLKYVDANNLPYQQQFDLTMPFYSTSQLKKFGIVQSSNSWIFLIIIATGIGGYVWYRKKKKKEQ